MEFTNNNLQTVDRMLDAIVSEEIKEYRNNKAILEGIVIVHDTQEPVLVIEDWIKKGFTKKEIILMVNNNL